MDHYLPAILNVIQLIGWTIFEIMIMSKAAEMLVGNFIPFYVWTIIFGGFVTLLGILGPLTVVRQWLGKFAIWIVYASSIIMIIQLDDIRKSFQNSYHHQVMECPSSPHLIS